MMENTLFWILFVIVPIFDIWWRLGSCRIFIKSLSLRVHIILHWDGWRLIRYWKPYSRRGRFSEFPGSTSAKRSHIPGRRYLSS